MPKNFKKYFIILSLTLYCAVSFLNLADISVCFAKDHTELKFIGANTCCNDVYQNPKCENALSKTDKAKDCCKDVKLSSDVKYEELTPACDGCGAVFYTCLGVIAFFDRCKSETSNIYPTLKNKSPPNVLAFLDTVVLVI